MSLTPPHGEGKGSASAGSGSTTPDRAVTLTCAPATSGTHPDAARACAELRASGGDFDTLAGRGKGMCTREYRPVVVTVDGVWQGRRVSYERTFANECVRNSSQGRAVFAF
jgi:hypothetical protein